jgi:hypothetical protein
MSLTVYQAATTRLTEEHLQYLRDNNIEPETGIYANFWQTLSANYDKILALVKKQSSDALIFLNSYLDERIRDRLEFELSYGLVNGMQEITGMGKNVELYISPKCRRVNIPVMLALYRSYTGGIRNLGVYCYRHHRDGSVIPEQLSVPVKSDVPVHTWPRPAMEQKPTITLHKRDMGFQVSAGFMQDASIPRPIVNIAIFVSRTTAAENLEEREVSFVKDNGETSSRKILIPTNNMLDLMLVSALGEEVLLNYVGYIEYVVDEEQKTALNAPDSTEVISDRCSIDELRDEVAVCLQQYTRLFCDYCSRSNGQSKMSKCTKCGNGLFCSPVCYSLSTSRHAYVCQKVGVAKPADSTI